MADRSGQPSPLDNIPSSGLRKVARWGLLINLATFMIGYATGVISGALLYIRGDLDLGDAQQGLVTSILLLGAMVAAMFTGGLADRFGRKAMLGCAGVLFLLGFAGSALATGFELLLLGRLVMGLGVGIASALVPTYLGEISPAQIRGRMLTLNQLLQTVGMLVAYVVNLAFSGSGDWRAMFWVGAIPAVLLAVIVVRLPESPAWLIAKGRTDSARSLIESVAGAEGADQVIERYREQDEEQRQQRQRDPSRERKGWGVLLVRRVRPALVVAIGLAALQQFVGINTVLYYAPTIMEDTGLSASNSIVYSVVIGVVNLGMTIVSLRLIDRIGRRPLLLTSLIGMGISVALLGVSFIVDLGAVTLLVCMLVFVSSFAIGIGPVLWVILGEIFPPNAQAEGAGAGSAVSWLSNFVMSTAFLPLTGVIGSGAVFLIFALVCLLALAFVYRLVPETKDRDFDHIDAELQVRAHGRKPDTPAA
ncbi:sugar porter family MFS transporter [Rhodococcus sp. NPDC058521]|uniref:sugar porter family MFS transporter n=1 Tax=Rhodococcus sp. NPDC058521 TaxID=3346536 RepID=UPI0036487EF5